MGFSAKSISYDVPYWALCNQSFLYENVYSGDESNAKVLFEYPSTTFVYTKT